MEHEGAHFKRESTLGTIRNIPLSFSLYFFTEYIDSNIRGGTRRAFNPAVITRLLCLASSECHVTNNYEETKNTLPWHWNLRKWAENIPKCFEILLVMKKLSQKRNGIINLLNRLGSLVMVFMSGLRGARETSRGPLPLFQAEKLSMIHICRRNWSVYVKLIIWV